MTLVFDTEVTVGADGVGGGSSSSDTDTVTVTVSLPPLPFDTVMAIEWLVFDSWSKLAVDDVVTAPLLVSITKSEASVPSRDHVNVPPSASVAVTVPTDVPDDAFSATVQPDGATITGARFSACGVALASSDASPSPTAFTARTMKL